MSKRVREVTISAAAWRSAGPPKRKKAERADLQTLCKRLRAKLEIQRDPVAAVQMKAYMKNKFEFLGLKSPVRRRLYKEFRTEQDLELVTEGKLLEWVELLWHQSYREFHYIAVDELIACKKLLTADGAAAVERLVTRSSWWDTVDMLATNVLGTYYKTRPEEMENKIRNVWSLSDNLWLNRTGILVQLNHKHDTRLDLLHVAITPHVASSEFFLQKSIGWALRELAKTNPNWVRSYLRDNTLKPLSVREALRIIGS